MTDQTTINQLKKFLKEYEQASNSCNFYNVEPLIDQHATYWFTNGTFEGIKEIRKAFEDTWKHIKDEKYVISNINWVSADENLAVCTYDFKSDGLVNSKRQVYSGRGTQVFVKAKGKWKIKHEHLSKKI